MSDEAKATNASGELQSEMSSDVLNVSDNGKDTLSVAVQTPMPQSPEVEKFSPRASSTKKHAMAVTVEDCEDESEHPSISPVLPAPSLASPASPSLNNIATSPTTTTRSRSSGRSGATVTRVNGRPSVVETKPEETRRIQSPEHRAEALAYLDADSPGVTEEAIHEAARYRYQKAPNQVSPSMKSPSSSVPSHHADVFSEHATDGNSYGSWSPDDTIPGQSPSFIKLNGHASPAHHHPQPQRPFHVQYGGTPEMGRGNSHIPYFTPGTLPPPLFQAPPPLGHPAHAENIPPSGYQLLASKLAGGIHGPPVRPIYRRFEALNHRILLHLQDEIAELEEQLHGLDTADTQNRRYPGGIWAASRRQDSMSAGELFARKTHILGNVGFKLTQYNQVMASFKETQDLSPPTRADIHDYRSFLAAGSAVVEDETRFLEATDLVSLVRLPMPAPNPNEILSEDVLTPMPRPAGEAGFPPGRPMSSSSVYSGTWRSSIPATDRAVPATLAQLTLAMSVAMLVPILTFAVIPGFVGRMTVVLLVGLGVATAMLQSGLFKLLASDRGALDWILYAGVYGGVMAVVASTFG